MKQIKLTLAICCALLLGGVATSFAQGTAYMCSQAGIKFTIPASGDYDLVEWSLGSDVLVNGTNGVTIEDGGLTLKIGTGSTLFELASVTAAESKTVHVKVAKDGEGCYSDLQDYTVNILPKPEVAITSTITNYCMDNPTGSTITALTTAFTNLPADVTVNQFAWDNGTALGGGTVTSPAAGQWQSVLDYTSPNNTTPVTYSVTVAYSLPGGATLIGGCSTSDAATIGVQSYPVPAAPSITVSPL